MKTTQKASTMTTAGNVKTEKAKEVGKDIPVQTVATPASKEPAEEEKEHISPAETAKRIKAVAKQSDQYEFEDGEEARDVFKRLPEGEFKLKEGNLFVIQKL